MVFFIKLMNRFKHYFVQHYGNLSGMRVSVRCFLHHQAYYDTWFSQKYINLKSSLVAHIVFCFKSVIYLLITHTYLSLLMQPGLTMALKCTAFSLFIFITEFYRNAESRPDIGARWMYAQRALNRSSTRRASLYTSSVITP